MPEIKEFVNFFFTDYPFPTALLLVILGLGLYWFFNLRPKELKQKLDTQEKERELKEKQLSDAQQRDIDFRESLNNLQSNNEKLNVLYEKALENSTKAIDNNTAVIKLLGDRTTVIETKQDAQIQSLKELTEDNQKILERTIETNIMLRKESI